MWTPNYFKLFLSHRSDSAEIAHDLKECLAPHLISCFVAHDDIEPTREWEDEILLSLRTMDALGAILVPNFRESKWTDQEVGFAIGSGKLVLPFRYGADPHGFIRKYQGYTIKVIPYLTIAEDIRKILTSNSTTSPRMAETYIHALETAWSWEAVKTYLARLAECSVIPEELLVRLDLAPETNAKIRDTYGALDKISILLRRHRELGTI